MGPGLWKLNLTILEEDEFISRITEFWFFWQRCQLGFSTLTQCWDTGKSHIKHLSINYCKNCNKSECSERNIPTNLVAHLKTHADSGRLSLLNALDCEVVHDAKVWAWARWVEEGDSSTAYFFHLEKKRAADR